MAAAILLVWLALFGLDLDVGYLFQLARGQMRLLVRQEPIEKVLKRPDLDPVTASRLRFVQEVRVFGEETLGMEVSRNYTTFVDLEGRAAVWNLSVAPKNRLEPLTWNYPIVGRVPYRGYFKREQAESEAGEWSDRGFDIYLRPVSAYSTLGWFTDPVLSTMLSYGDVELASVVLHEMMHATLWIEDDAGFNESLATFVGDVGGLQFIRERLGDHFGELREAKDRRADSERFRGDMHHLAAQLEELYAEDLPLEETLDRREELFQITRESLAQEPWRTKVYAGLVDIELNNARLAAFRVYHREEIFAEVYEALGEDLRASVEVFRECETVRDPRQYLRRWLDRGKVSP